MLYLRFFSFLAVALSVSASSWKRDNSTGYGTITTSTNGSVVRATINNPPLNLNNEKFITDFHSFLSSLSSSDAPKVVIIDSANSDWFVAHMDINILIADPPYPNAANISALYGDSLQLLQSLPVIFIGQVSGRAYGAGDEILLHCDMRFAGPGALLGGPEIALGVTHTNAIQYLTKLIGKGRATQYLVGAEQADAQTAASLGWVNAAYDSVGELTSAVDSLAARIASFSAGGINATKVGVAANNPSAEAAAADGAMTGALIGTPEVQTILQKFKTLSKNQMDMDFEKNLFQNVGQLTS